MIDSEALYKAMRMGKSEQDLAKEFHNNLNEAIHRKSFEDNFADKYDDTERLLNDLLVFINRHYPEARDIFYNLTTEEFAAGLDLLIPEVVEIIERITYWKEKYRS
jgi:aspartyl/asparaginyl-tRNA synthetase